MLRDIHPRLRVWQYEGLRGARQCVWAGSKWHLRAMPGKCGAGPRGTNMRREYSLLPGVAINELYRPAIPLVTSFATAWGQGESPQTGLVPISLSVTHIPRFSRILKATLPHDLPPRAHPYPSHTPHTHTHTPTHTSGLSTSEQRFRKGLLGFLAQPLTSGFCPSLPQHLTSHPNILSERTGARQACSPSLSNRHALRPEGHGCFGDPV